MTTTALTTTHKPLTQDVWAMIQSIAPVMKDSRLFGVASTEQAAAVMLKGHELGLSLTASFEFIHVIESKPTLAPRGALALILGSPLCDGVEIKNEMDAQGNPTGCSVTMKRKGGLTYTARFTMEDAKRADLIKDKGGWIKYPGLMCQWRAVGFAADVVFPDLLNGLKRSDELGADLTPGGEIIDGSWTAQVGSQQGQVTAGDAPKTVIASGGGAVSQPGLTVQDLLKTYTAAQIMTANDGRIPATVEECQRVKDTLGGLDE